MWKLINLALNQILFYQIIGLGEMMTDEGVVWKSQDQVERLLPVGQWFKSNLVGSWLRVVTVLLVVGWWPEPSCQQTPQSAEKP